MPGKGIQFEPVVNYQTALHYSYFNQEKTPEKCIQHETAPIYQNTPGQVHEGDHCFGQQNPNYAYYQHNVHLEMMPGKGTDPEPELNYQTAPVQVHESDHGLGPQNLKHAHFRFNMYSQKLLGKGIKSGSGPNYQNDPHYAYYQPNGYPEKIPKEGIMFEQAMNYQTAPGQGHGSVYNMGKSGGQNRNLGYQALPGLSPDAEAAVVALTQLVQFAESMEDATWTGQWAGPAEPLLYMGSGGRGGIPFRRTALGKGHEEPKRETPNPNKAPIPYFLCLLCKVDCNC